METTEMVATTEPLATDVAEELASTDVTQPLASTDVMAAMPTAADGSAAADGAARRTATG